MNSDEFLLENLPAEMRFKLKELAQSLGKSEEEIASEIIQLVVEECEDHAEGKLKDFVLLAKAALKKP